MHNKKTNGLREQAECIENQTGQTKTSNSASESQSVNPASIASEKAILGALLEDDDLVMPVVIESGLRSADFFLNQHRRLFAGALSLWQEKKHIDAILLTEHLGNRVEDVVAVANCIHGAIVHPDHVANHIEIVRNKARLRALLQLGEWIPKVVDDFADPDLLIEQAISRLERIARPEVGA